MINGKIGQTTKLSLCARKEKSLYCTLVLPRNSSTFLHLTFPRIKTRLSRAQGTCRARSIQPKFKPVRPGKEDHLKRWTCFFETFPVGPNRSIEFWTEISGNFGWMDRARRSRKSRSQTLQSHWSAPRTRPLGKGNAGSLNVLSPPGSASLSYFVDLICLKNKK